MDNEIKIKVSADVSGLASLDSALASAQQQVKAAATSMAEAQLAFGKAAEQGSEQAQAALAEYTAALKTAEDQLDSLEAAQARAKGVSLARPQAAQPSTAPSWRDEAAAQAQKTGISAAPQLTEEATAAQIDATSIAELTAAKEAAAASSADLAASTEAETASDESIAASSSSVVAATNEKAAANARYAASTADSVAASTAIAEADDGVVASNAAVGASAETAVEQNAAFAASFARNAAALAAYEKAAKGSTEQSALLGKAFDEAIASGAGLTEAMEAAVAAINQFTESEVTAGAAAAAQSAAMKEAAASTVSGSVAAQGALRTLEGSMFGASRAAGELLTKSLGLGPVLSAAFPVIGAVALISIVSQVGEALYETIHNADQAGEAISQAFGDASDKVQATTDQIVLQNSKLQDEIDKLSGHLDNGLQTALDEDIVAADKLQDALDGVVKKIDAIYKDKNSQIGLGASLLTGRARTGDVTEAAGGIVDNAGQAAQQAKNQYDAQLAGAGGDKAKVIAATKAYHEAIQKIIDDANAKLQPSLDENVRMQKAAEEALGEDPSKANILKRMRVALGEAESGQAVNVADYSARIADLQKAQDLLNKLKAQMEAMEAQAPLEQKKGKLEQDKSGASEASKAAEQHLRNLEAVFAQEELQYGVSANQTAAYWGQYLNTFKQGSSESEQVLEKVIRAQQELGKLGANSPDSKINAALKKEAEEAKKDSAEYVRAIEDMARASAALFKEQGTGETEDAAAEHQKILDQMEEAQAKGQASYSLKIIQDPAAQLNELRAFHQQVIQEDERFIQQEIAIAADHQQVDEVKKLEKQLEEARHQGNMQWIKDTEATTQQVEKQIQEATKKMQQDFNQLFAKALSGQETWAKAAMQLYKQVSDTFIENILKMAEQYLVGLATQKTGQLSQIESSAATAAANTYAAVSAIPIIGPALAPEAAAAAFAAVLAFESFEAGGIVGGGRGMPVPIMAHAGERVLSAPQTQNFERMVNQPAKSGNTFNLNYHGQVNAYDRNGMRSTLQSHANDILDIVREGWNTGALR